MSDPHSAIPEHAQPQIWRRYENYRAMRYERSQRKYAGRFPHLRNRRSARWMVVGLAISLALLLVAGCIAFYSSEWFLIPFIPSFAGIAFFLTLLRVISGSVADAPISALDEIQLAQRNSARSIGFIVLFSLMFIPYLAMIFVGSASETVPGQVVYGFAILLIGFVLVGTCVPTILTCWWMAEPDPEDFIDDVDEHEPAQPVVAEPPSATTPTIDAPAGNDPPAPAPW